MDFFQRPEDGRCAVPCELPSLVEKVASEHCSRLQTSLGFEATSRTVVAAIVMTADGAEGTTRAWVVASGQGTKVLSPPKPPRNTNSSALDTGKRIAGKGKGKKRAAEQTAGMEDFSGAEHRLKDLHAEPLCRRGFHRFLYGCIRQHQTSGTAGSSSSSGGGAAVGGDGAGAATPVRGHQQNDDDAPLPFIFQQQQVDSGASASASANARPNAENNGALLKLRPGIRFHLYVSSCPCGSARLATESAAAAAAAGVGGKGKGRSVAAGGGRSSCSTTCIVPGHTGMTSAAAVPYEPDAAAAAGSAAAVADVKMSCTDKIAVWTVVGLQGAALSLCMQPVYLASIVVGGHGDPRAAVLSAIVHRMSNVTVKKVAPTTHRTAAAAPPSSSLPLYSHHIPAVHRATRTGDDPSLAQGARAKSPWSSLCLTWNADSGAEQIKHTTGMYHLAKYPYTATPSAICKSRLFDALLAVAAVKGNTAVGPTDLRRVAVAAAAATSPHGEPGNAAATTDDDSCQPPTKKQKKGTKKKKKKTKKKTKAKDKQLKQVACPPWPPPRRRPQSSKEGCGVEGLGSGFKFRYEYAKSLAVEYGEAKEAAKQEAGRWCSRSQSYRRFN